MTIKTTTITPTTTVSRKSLRRISRTLPLLLLMLAQLPVGCTSDGDTSNTGTPRSGGPVAFSLGFGSAATRSTIDNVWPNSTRISVSNATNTYVYVTDSNSSQGASEQATTLTPESDIFYWPIDDPSWKFTAWFPVGDAPVTDITVSADQRDKDKEGAGISETDYCAYDILYCPPTEASFWQTVPLDFYHQLTRVVVSVGTDQTDAKEKVTGIVFGGNQLALSGRIKTLGTTGEDGSCEWYEPTTANQSIQMRNRTTKELSNANTYVFECLLPPQSTAAAGASLIKITTEGSEDGVRTYTFNDPDKVVLQAGYQYTYSLAVSEAGVISLPSVQVYEWSITENVTGKATIPDNGY